jgi:hypothetical protein
MIPLIPYALVALSVCGLAYALAYAWKSTVPSDQKSDPIQPADITSDSQIQLIAREAALDTLREHMNVIVRDTAKIVAAELPTSKTRSEDVSALVPAIQQAIFDAVQNVSPQIAASAKIAATESVISATNELTEAILQKLRATEMTPPLPDRGSPDPGTPAIHKGPEISRVSGLTIVDFLGNESTFSQLEKWYHPVQNLFSQKFYEIFTIDLETGSVRKKPNVMPRSAMSGQISETTPLATRTGRTPRAKKPTSP